MGDWVTASGFVPKTVERMLTELAAKQHATIDANLNVEPDEPLGQLNGIIASALREAWEVLAECYSSFDPDAAEGVPLENVSAITGTNRHAATKGTVYCDCTFDDIATLTHGTTFANVENMTANLWTPKETYTSSGAGTFSVLFEAIATGPIPAYAGKLNVETTTVAHWTSVTNPEDATLGTDEDTDPQLRVRREQELRATGSATPDAMRADLLDDDRIRQAQILENVTDLIDENSLPPHAIECIVDDGIPSAMTDDEIAQAIWETRGAGKRTTGLLSGVAVDTLGNQHTMYFSRPLPKDVWLELDLVVNIVGGYAGEALLKQALIAKALEKQLVGRDVIAKVYDAVAMSFAGVIDVTELRLGFASTPTGTANLLIGAREMAVLDTGRILVNITEATPP